MAKTQKKAGLKKTVKKTAAKKQMAKKPVAKNETDMMDITDGAMKDIIRNAFLNRPQ